MSDFVLHAGLPKTATTSIQRGLFAQHSQVFYLGKHPVYLGKKGCLTRDVYRALSPALWNIRAGFKARESRRVFEEHVYPKMRQGQVLVGSWEALASGGGRAFSVKLKRTASIFDGCKLMFTIRNPLNWLSSLYLQELRGHFVKRNRKHMGTRPYLEFEDWIECKKKQVGGSDIFRYGPNINEALALFGKDNVGVFLFEDLVERPRNFYAQVCGFLGINLRECLELTADVSLHPRISQGQLEMMQHVDGSLAARAAWVLMSRQLRSKRLRKAGESAGPSNKKVIIEPSPGVAGYIEQTTRDWHRWLAQEFALPLEKYGYPV